MERPPIIDHFPKRSRWRRWLQTGSTAFIWTLYAYLFLPLATALAWWAGFDRFKNQVWIKEPLEDAFVMITLPVIALICGILMVGWAEYNRRRFISADRRRRRETVDEKDVAISLGADDRVAQLVRRSRICRVELDDRAQPSDASMLMPLLRRDGGHLPAPSVHEKTVRNKSRGLDF